MTNFPKWQDIRDDIVAGPGGEQAVAEARHRNQAYIDGHRLAERRKALGPTWAEVAERMRVTKSRVSRIDRGEVSTIEAVARYVHGTGLLCAPVHIGLPGTSGRSRPAQSRKVTGDRTPTARDPPI